MKKFILITILLLLATAFVYVGCKDENDNPPPEEEIFGDSQTEEQNQVIDSCSVPTPPMDSILDVNGVPYGNNKSGFEDGSVDKLVHHLIAFTRVRCEAKKTTQHSEAQPIHMGYAYSYGQRNMNARLFPPEIYKKDKTEEQLRGNALHRKYAVWGTDCSGLLINAIRSAGVQITTNCNSVGLPSSLSIALGENDEYKNLIIEDQGKLDVNLIKSGDIIVWPNVKHIGIAGRVLGNDVDVFQSNGTGFPEDYNNQETNWTSSNRGVHPYSLNKMLSLKKGWPEPYTIWRIKEKDPNPTGFTITTKAITAITQTTAQSGGDIIVNSKDSVNISMRGVCWGITANPTVIGSITNDGSGTGSYLSSIEGLTAATTYYVRAYAVSDSKTYYGNQLSFQATGGGSGNESSFTINFDGLHTGNGYDVCAYNGEGDIYFYIPEIECHINLLHGDDLFSGDPFILGTQAWVGDCFDPSYYGNIAFITFNPQNGSSLMSFYVQSCDDEPKIGSNATVDITFLTENQIAGSFIGIVASQQEIPPLVSKPISGTFNIYYVSK